MCVVLVFVCLYVRVWERESAALTSGTDPDPYVRTDSKMLELATVTSQILVDSGTNVLYILRFDLTEIASAVYHDSYAMAKKPLKCCQAPLEPNFTADVIATISYGDDILTTMLCTGQSKTTESKTQRNLGRQRTLEQQRTDEVCEQERKPIRHDCQCGP